jgi:hypothetical protein
MKSTALMMMLGLGALAWAEPDAKEVKKEAIVMRLEAVQVSDQVARQWKEGGALKSDALEDDGVRLLQTTEVSGLLDNECVTFIGRKNPIVYYDPRATQFQVQYVDIGAKLNCLCKSAPPGHIKAQLYTELSLLDRNVLNGGASYPGTAVFKQSVEVPPFDYGDHVVVGTVQGSEAQHYLQLLGASNSPKNDNVYFVLSVEKL